MSFKELQSIFSFFAIFIETWIDFLTLKNTENETTTKKKHQHTDLFDWKLSVKFHPIFTVQPTIHQQPICWPFPRYPLFLPPPSSSSPRESEKEGAIIFALSSLHPSPSCIHSCPSSISFQLPWEGEAAGGGVGAGWGGRGLPPPSSDFYYSTFKYCLFLEMPFLERPTSQSLFPSPSPLPLFSLSRNTYILILSPVNYFVFNFSTVLILPPPLLLPTLLCHSLCFPSYHRVLFTSF